MVPNITTIVLTLYGLVCLGVVHALLFLLSKICTFIVKLNRHISRFLYFKGILVFLMESYMEFMLAALINLKQADWDTPFPFEVMSNATSVFLIVIGAVLPFAIVLFYVKKVDQWN